MNNLYRTLKKILLAFALTFISFTGYSQEDVLSAEEMEELKGQVSHMVDFLQFSLNMLGDDNTPASQKEIIIYESYTKIFADDKVQVEDDLDDQRSVIINKDVQAYLKDIDFFFKGVNFEFDIEKIEPQFNEKNQLFFLITLNRKIEGTTIKGDTLKNNLVRYIEINYDRLEKDIKIASIYSTKLDEDKEYMHWWNTLNDAWRDYMASDVKIFDTLMLTDVISFNDTAIVVYKNYIAQEIDTVINIGDTLLTVYGAATDTIAKPDTIPYHTSILVNKIKSLTKKTEIDVSENYSITDLEPLSRFRKLEKLNCSNTTIHDLTPIRNLSKLEFLDCSESDVYDISVLRYCENLRDLRLNGTPLRDISVLESFEKLEILYFSNTRVNDITPLSNCNALKDLRINATEVENLGPVSGLNNLTLFDCSETHIRTLQALGGLESLQRLYCSGTSIHDIRHLSGLKQLQTLNIDNTKVSSLQALNGLESLEKIYCDNTQITRKIADEFMENNPGVLVIYESSTLQSWWENLSIDWQLKFTEYFEEDLIPTKEQLHQIINITEIDISNNGRISNIEPLSKLEKLQTVNLDYTIIDELDPLDDHVDLRVIKARGSKVKSLIALKDLINLQDLNVSATMVSDLSPLIDLPQLQIINLDDTKVSSLLPLKNNSNIKTIYCDNTGVTLADALELYKYLPECLIIYQTEDLENWWKGIPIAWRKIFSEKEGIQDMPDKYQLHRITNIMELDLNGNKSIQSLTPVYPLQRLQTLKISSTGISELGPLHILRFLVKLDASNNPVNDISPLSTNKSLIYLDIKNTPLEDLTPVSKLINLETLYCSGTNIKDLKFAMGLSNLRDISFYNTRVKNLKEIENLFKLEKVECYNTKISERKVEKFREKLPDCEVVFY